MKLVDQSIWSDEVEMLAKILAWLKAATVGKSVRWETQLPARFVPGAVVSDIPNEHQLVEARRQVSAQLDSLFTMFGTPK